MAEIASAHVNWHLRASAIRIPTYEPSLVVAKPPVRKLSKDCSFVSVFSYFIITYFICVGYLFSLLDAFLKYPRCLVFSDQVLPKDYTWSDDPPLDKPIYGLGGDPPVSSELPDRVYRTHLKRVIFDVFFLFHDHNLPPNKLFFNELGIFRSRLGVPSGRNRKG